MSCYHPSYGLKACAKYQTKQFNVTFIKVAPSGPAPVKDEPLPDLSRRNTIVVPPAFQEVEQDIEEIVEEGTSVKKN